jgi:hypothetical protein
VPRRPSYKPHDFLKERGAWDTDDPVWKPVDSPDRAAVLASVRLQHYLSRRVWMKLRVERLSVETLAATIGAGPDHLWRKLSGTSPASTADLAMWAWLTGSAAEIPRFEDAFEGMASLWPTE